MENLKITGLSAEQLFTRQTFLLQSIISGSAITNSNTTWEELTCVGYNPSKGKLQAIVSIKQASGYSGGLCSNGSKEYVRFFVDFKDGSGFQDMGYTSFKVADISEAPAGPQHPLKYMTSLYINDEQYRRFLSCNQAVIPTVRAILSWNSIPAADPAITPYYGNVKDVNIQLPRKKFIIWQDIFTALNVKEKPDFLANIDLQAKVDLPPAGPVPPLEQLYTSYKRADVPDHRTFYATVATKISNGTRFYKAAAAYNLAELFKLKIDINAISKLILQPVGQADVTFEELTCVGLNTAQDTLGAVIRVKKNSGFSGDMCHAGSQEHVAFWADWDNNGTFTQYLGTASVTVHDISNIPADGICYNVELPVNLSKHIKSCVTPNIIRVRAVLSWSSLPSTTNPNALNTWGNRVDAVVQIRTGQAAHVEGEITLVGGVDRDAIDPVSFLVNASSTPTQHNNRPYGGWVSFHGIINRNGFNGELKYRIEYKKYGAADNTYAPVSTAENFSMIDFNPDPNLEYVDAQHPADGWFIYKANPALGIYNENNYLAGWSTGGLADGNYTIRFAHYDATGTVIYPDTFTVVICNEPMTISPTANTSLDVSKSIDLIITGGDCHCYDKTNTNHLISGELRATHPYFAAWDFDLQPAAHINGAAPVPLYHHYNAVGDTGNASLPWQLDVQQMDTCGYALSIAAQTRVILNSNTQFPWYGVKAVGFSVSNKCPNT